jgi:hypothetical protein
MPSAVIGPSARAISAKQLRWALAHTKKLRWARKRASQPSGRTPHCVLPACLPSYADYILRLDTEPESLEIMLRLLIVALPLVFALPAAFDNQETNAIQFEVQSTLQFEVRSPPESRPLLPREINTTSLRHTPLRTHNTQAHTSPCTRRGTRARTRRSTPAINYWQQPLREPRDTNPPPGPAGGHACSAGSFRTALRCARARERERQRYTCCRRTHAPRAPSAPAPAPTTCPPRGAPSRKLAAPSSA